MIYLSDKKIVYKINEVDGDNGIGLLRVRTVFKII